MSASVIPRSPFSPMMSPSISMSLYLPLLSLFLLCLHVVSSFLYSLPSLYFYIHPLSLPSGPLSACLCSPFSFILFFIIMFYIYLSPSFCFLLVDTPASSILVVYFVSLKPCRWIIEQTDPWLYSCCSGVMHWSFLIPYRFFKCFWSATFLSLCVYPFCSA